MKAIYKYLLLEEIWSPVHQDSDQLYQVFVDVSSVLMVRFSPGSRINCSNTTWLLTTFLQQILEKGSFYISWRMDNRYSGRNWISAHSHRVIGGVLTEIQNATNSFLNIFFWEEERRRDPTSTIQHFFSQNNIFV